MIRLRSGLCHAYISLSENRFQGNDESRQRQRTDAEDVLERGDILHEVEQNGCQTQ